MIRRHVLFVLRVIVALTGIAVCLIVVALGAINAFLRAVHEDLQD